MAPFRARTAIASVVAGLGIFGIFLSGQAAAVPAALPTISIDSAEGTNYQTEPSTITFEVSLSQPSSIPVTVDYSTRDEDAGPDDYTPTAGTLTFAPGEVMKTIDIELLPENGEVYERDEIFYVDLRNPVNATLMKDVAVGVIHFSPEPTPEQVNVSSTGNRGQCVKTVESGTCQPLSGEWQFKLDDITFINPRGGKVDLRTTEGDFRFSGAPFDLSKIDAGSSGTGKPMTVVTLRGGSFAACKQRTASGTRSTAKTKPKAVRRLWGRGKGHFRTRGRYSSGTVRGTYWVTIDRCDGTRTYVRDGVVSVWDFVLKKKVRVTTGHGYLASPSKKK